MPKVKVPRLCSRSQPGIKVIIRDLRGHLLHTVTFLVFSSKREMHIFNMPVTFFANFQIDCLKTVGGVDYTFFKRDG